MAEEFNTDSTLTTKELAKHLRQPDGERGKQVGLQMNKGNKYICLNSYKVLNPKNGDHVLEIGMGNGFFIKDLLGMAKDMTYVGLDFSETMIQEATLLNKDFIEKGIVSFKQASIENLPFDDNSFDSITTTNTLYFWPNPAANAKELLRVLKSGGKLLIGYRGKDCMDQLELTKYNFEKYKIEDVENLIKAAGFNKVVSEIIDEPELKFGGKVRQMKGIYTTGNK